MPKRIPPRTSEHLQLTLGPIMLQAGREDGEHTLNPRQSFLLQRYRDYRGTACRAFVRPICRKPGAPGRVRYLSPTRFPSAPTHPPDEAQRPHTCSIATVVAANCRKPANNLSPVPSVIALTGLAFGRILPSGPTRRVKNDGPTLDTATVRGGRHARIESYQKTGLLSALACHSHTRKG
jgi:hypothetical protein